MLGLMAPNLWGLLSEAEKVNGGWTRMSITSAKLVDFDSDTVSSSASRKSMVGLSRAVVRFSAVAPGFLRPSILLPSRRKLGTDEFLWSTRRGVGRHSCFRGRLSVLKREEWAISVQL
ncbi:hypothetical protein EYF80_034455 [Liparis tanakae]|uniref:Uncharacterized protein n=1 Tax=Liparis tanakae TaxID=230148 RepID=A0A4Z2GRC7_9TELE|nr:hypothetical protein EYF80_034455 [Liparis tanakae]